MVIFICACLGSGCFKAGNFLLDVQQVIDIVKSVEKVLLLIPVYFKGFGCSGGSYCNALVRQVDYQLRFGVCFNGLDDNCNGLVDEDVLSDLDGDGVYDYVIKQPNANIDPYEKYWKPSPTTYKLEAYGHDGGLLWRFDLGWAIEQGIWYSPYVVYDLDGDGRVEVLFVHRDELRVYDGATGTLRRKAKQLEEIASK